MGLRAALVDLGYLQRKRVTGRKVEGRTIAEPTEGPGFRCRLDVNSTAKRTLEGWTRTDPRPHLLTGLVDAGGNKLQFRSSDQIRVVSAELGEAVYEVDGDPEPLRRKRRLLGWNLTLHRVEEQTASAI